MGFAQDIAGMFGGSDAGFGSGDPDSTSNSSWSTGSSNTTAAAGLGLAGLGLGIMGTMQGISAAKSSAQSGIAMAGLEQQVNDKRQQAMQVMARRQQMQVLRTNQQTQAQATAAATNQGAQFGSGLQGGLSGIRGQSASNLLGMDQQLDIGNQIFGLDAQISQQKMKQFQAQSDSAGAQGWTALGSSVLKSAASAAMFV